MTRQLKLIHQIDPRGRRIEAHRGPGPAQEADHLLPEGLLRPVQQQLDADL
jgi:hypothetical protein